MLISITTLPTRINKIEPVIASLRKQGIPIYLWIPQYVERLDAKFDGKIPSFLDDIHCRVIEDKGSLTKFMGWNITDELFFTADDDTIVPKDWAKNLLDYYHTSKEMCTCCYRGRVFRENKALLYKNTSLVETPKEITKVDLVMSNWGALYNKNMFTDEAFNHHKAINDDVAVGAYLHKKNIPIYCLPSKDITNTSICRVNSLWAINKKSNNTDNAINALWKKEE